ncbi:MAG: hypothetical protein Q9226_002140 [Calogaya cf. arnoldii]
MYGTEEEIGIAIKEANIPRDKPFITNKFAQGIEDIPRSEEVTDGLFRFVGFLHPVASSKELTDTTSRYLIHVLSFAKSKADFQHAWKSTEEMKQTGKVKSIGVSNYQRADIEATLDGATLLPVINQIEYHPYLQRANQYIPWMREKGIQVASFKGLTPAFRCPEGPLQEHLARIAEAHNTT